MKTNSTVNARGIPGDGPSIVGPHLWSAIGGNPGRLLSAEERAQLAVISSIARYRKGERLYAEGERAEAVFNIVTGVVEACTTTNGTKHVLAFLFPEDLVGLAQSGTYVNSAEAVTNVTAYRLPVAALEARLRRDPRLEFHVICKLCHDLRQSQRHAILLGKQHATARVGLFLQMLEAHQESRGEHNGEVYLPMSRKDIASYAGLSPEAVIRALRALETRGAIAVRNRRHVKIINRAELETAVSDDESPITATLGRPIQHTGASTASLRRSSRGR